MPGGDGDLIPAIHPIGQIPLDTTEAPRSRVNPGDIARSGAEMGRGLKEAGAGLMDLATPIAEAQAASDLQNQKVTIGPDGKIQVINPARSFAFGQAGDAAARVIQQGTVSQAGATVDTALTDIHMKHLGDPAGQATANDAFVNGLKGLTGNPLIDNAVQNKAREAGAQHLDHNIWTTTNLKVQSSAQDLTAQKTDVEESLATLAQAGMGAGNPKYDQLMDQRKAIQEQFAGNILLKHSPDMVALEDKQFGSFLQKEHLINGLDQIVKTSGIKAGLDAADAIRLDPTLKASDRARLWTEARARLQQMAPEAEERVRASTENVGLIVKGMDAAGDRPLPADLRTQAFGALHDAEAAGDLTGAGVLRAQMMIHGIPMSALKDDGSAGGGVTTSPLPGGTGGFDLASYKGRTSQIEGGGSEHPPDSSTGAGGKYQFTPATWVKSGGVGDLHGNQEAAMDNLTAANRADLQKGLGREATPAETYLAHQQGSAGALALINHPDQRAGDLVSDKAIRVNGGDPNAPASQFVKMWDAKFNGASPAGGGLRRDFTPQEYAANPMLRSQVLRSMVSDPEEKYSFLAAKGSMIDTISKVGIEPPAEDLAAIKQGAMDHPGDPKFGKLWADVAGYQMAREAVGAGSGGGGMPTRADREAQINQLVNGPDIVMRQVAAVAQQKEIDLDKFAKEHTHTFGANAGWAPAVPPLDASSPLQQQMGPRVQMGIAAQAHGLSGSLFDPSEIGQVKAALSNPDPAVKASIYGAIASAPEGVRNATLAQLGGGEPQGMAEAAAGSLMGSNPELAKSIFRGMSAMKTDKRFDPEDEGTGSKQNYLADRDAAFPPSTFSVQGRTDPAGPYATLQTMVKARYADLKAQAGTFQYDKATVAQAVNDVTGGVLSHNGGSFIAPVRGMSQSNFDATLSGVTDGQMKGAVTLGGQPVTADYLRSNGQLESVGDGRYAVKLGRDPVKPVYAYAPNPRTGKLEPFTLDLSQNKPAPGYDAPADIVPGMQP